MPKSVVSFASNGPGETQYLASVHDDFGYSAGSFKSAASSTGTETMSVIIGPPSQDIDEPVVAVKPAISSSVSYRARVDDGSFNAYAFSNNIWTMYDKKGTRYIYGSDDSGRTFDASSSVSNQAGKWLLQEVRDTNDNYIKYTYLHDANDIYPYKIMYTGHGSHSD
jgi:Salmonella virulence plasmid 65kDa B protein